MTMPFNMFVLAMRPLNCLMAALAVFIGASIAFGGLAFQGIVLWAMIAAFLVCGAGQSINDFFDSTVDKQKQKRVAYQDLLEQHRYALLWFSLVLFVLGIGLAYWVNQTAFWIAVFISVLLVVYSAGLGKIKPIGNIVVALGTALPLVFGAAVFQDYRAVLWLAASAFFANWAREIVKDVEDLPADKGKKKTLPMILQPAAITGIVLVLVLAAIASALLAMQTTVFGNHYFLLLVILAGIVFLKAVQELHKEKPEKSQQSFKLGMLLALIAFLAGTL